MSELTPEIAADVIAACQEGAEEAASALSRALDGEFTLEVGESGEYTSEPVREGFDGAGLLIKLALGDAAAVVVLPAATGMTPDWCPTPDPTGESKLATLAQELGMLLLPEELMPEDFAAGWAPNVAEALTAGGVADGAGCVPLKMVAGETSGELTLVWPASKPAELIPPAEEAPAKAEATEQDAPQPVESQPATPEPAAASPADSKPAIKPPRRIINDFRDLPSYARSLLNIRVPLMVTVAEKQADLGDIVDLGPGSIITFEKPCDGPLSIEVSGEPLAIGEAVKVGEKFGVRISEMILPGEKLKTVVPPRQQTA